MSRLDQYLVERGDFTSRTRAAEAIKEGRVYVNGEYVKKTSYSVNELDDIKVISAILDSYVSRGALKLKKALEDFKVKVEGKIAIDMGSSTGGFTQVLLERGAAKVYAIDVGRDQLHESLRSDERIEVFEEQDIRTWSSPEKVDLVTGDLSFISLNHIIPLLDAFLRNDGEAVLLVKPQFEVGQEKVGKNGIVRNFTTHKKVLNALDEQFYSNGLRVKSVTLVPEINYQKNVEYLVLLSRELEGNRINYAEITGLAEHLWLKSK
ncbi:MAG: TlyA family RNA methyltransferase [Sphingobacteriia bacterium]|nr:TlyA family RNA methyltransferase [Sphingobacteriia bacterium]